MSVHDYAGRIEYWLRRIAEKGKEKGKEKEGKVDPYDYELARSFLDALRLAGVREGKMQTYAQFTYRIMEIMHEERIGKRIADLTREDIDRIAGIIVSRKNWSLATIAIVLRTLKRLVHYAKHREITEGSYCKEVEHIRPDRYKRKAMKEESVKVTDLLTREEFLKLVEAVPRVSRYPLRDRAMLYVMYEFASRPSELLNMRVKDVMLEDSYAVVSSYGKTGKKTLTLVLSYGALRDWLEQHPEKDNPEAFLWYSKTKNRSGEHRVSYDRLRIFIKRLAEEAGIKKRVWLYLFRHTALTHVEKELGSSITELYGNWRKGSPVRNRYVHLANSDQHEAVLKKYGLLKNEAGSGNSIVEMKRCYRCNTYNEPTARICRFCGLIIDKGYALQLHSEKDRRIEELENELKDIKALVEELIRRRQQK